jgi:hypothetical protein
MTTNHTTPTMQIPTTLFWKMYNCLRDTENILWESDGKISDQTLDQQIIENYKTIIKVLDRCEPVISSLKEIDANAN